MSFDWSNPRVWAVGALIAGMAIASWYGIRIERQVQLRFQERQTSFPSRIYARAPVVYRGMSVRQAGLAGYLDRAGYRPVWHTTVAPGEYMTGARKWILGVRPFEHANGRENGGKVFLELDGDGRIEKLSGETGRELTTVRIEPVEIGAFVPEDGKDRVRIELEDVPVQLIDAILVNEDRRFFDHIGIDLRRIVAALYTNLRSGRIAQGASTVTQQLVKAVYLSNERTLERKLREVLMSFILEFRYSKQDILQAYLNEIYLGQDGAVAIHGVGLAARHYFGKHLKELELAESALLAGLIRSPSAHAPFRHPEAALERRNFILGQMLDAGRISNVEYQSAVAAPLGLRSPVTRTGSAGYFNDYLRERLVNRYGNAVLERSNLSIYTTLDLRMQDLVEEIIRNRLEHLEEGSSRLKHDQSPLQAAIVVLEPRTGQILALVGGRDYTRFPFNRALARRQPGSIFKPVVMLSALQKRTGNEPRFTLASVLPDEPYKLTVWEKESEPVVWQPMNHDKGFRGTVTAREALERSLNVPIARLGAATGLTEIISTARRMGITSPLEPVPSLPLGSFETTLLEMVRAYGVFASGGLRAPLRDVLSVVGEDGIRHRIFESTPYRIFHASETYLITSALQGSVDRGTSTHLRDLGYYGAVAGKTGSTNRFRDAWFVGYTPEIVIGAWVGFDMVRGMGIPGAEAALPMVADFMIRILGPGGAARFAPPPGVERATVAIRKHDACAYLSEVFLPGTVPADACDEEGQEAGNADAEEDSPSTRRPQPLDGEDTTPRTPTAAPGSELDNPRPLARF